MNEALLRAGICQGVDEDAMTLLDRLLTVAEFRRGNVIFAEGEPGDRLYIVAAGKVKVGTRSNDGREYLLMVAGPSDMIGDLSIFDPGPRTSTATALTRVEAYAMDRPALREWISGRPQIIEFLFRLLARRLCRTNDQLSDLIFTDVPGRVARSLLRLARQFGTDEGGVVRVDHDLTQAELAALVGASRETVNKALSDFVHRGWVRLETRSVLILDPERLAGRAH